MTKEEGEVHPMHQAVVEELPSAGELPPLEVEEERSSAELPSVIPVHPCLVEHPYAGASVVHPGVALVVVPSVEVAVGHGVVVGRNSVVEVVATAHVVVEVEAVVHANPVEVAANLQVAFRHP